MEYNVFFDVAAMILTAMLLLIVYLRKIYNTKNCVLYKWMLWLNLAAAAFDVFSAWTIMNPYECPEVVNYLVNMGYLLFHNLTAVVFLLYVIRLVRGNYGTTYEKIFVGTVTAFDTLSLLTSPLTKLVFYFDEQRTYTHGPLLIGLYVAAGAMMFYALYLFVRYRKRMTQYQMITNIVFLSLLMVAVIYQYFFPNVLIEPFCVAISFLMLNVALDNPAMYFYGNSYCFNKKAFADMIGDKLRTQAPYCILSFAFDDFAVIKKKYGDGDFEQLMKNVIADCHEICGQKNVYILSEGQFAVDLKESNVITTVKSISAAFAQGISVNDEKTVLVPHFCVLTAQKEITKVNDVYDAIDTMLYVTYRKTGQRMIYSDPELLNARRREEQIIHALRNSIKNDDFEIYYQPIIEQKTGKFISAEALLRMPKQSFGFVGPDEFIPIAENNGMILEIGEIVMEKACRFWKEEHLEDLGIKYIDINLSMVQLQQMRTVRRLEEICIMYGIKPSSINFEITETAAASVEEKETIDRCMSYLRDKGFSFSLDDYGSGYATASYVAGMPFEIVKIDKNILWNAMKDRGYKVVLSNSVSLVRDLQMKCVVEGVETQEMVDMLSELGCDLFQGYLYSKPIPEKEFIEFIKKAVAAEGTAEDSRKKG